MSLTERPSFYAILGSASRVLQILTLTVGLVGAADVAAAAPITYTVALSGGGETVQGFITTDGVIGNITGHILDWAFTGTGNLAFTIASATGGTTLGLDEVLGASLTNLTLLAPADSPPGGQLFFVGAGASPGICGQPNVSFSRLSSLSYVRYTSDSCDPNPVAGFFSISTGATTIGSAQQAGTPVPEPGTLTLLGLGVAGLAASRRRARG